MAFYMRIMVGHGNSSTFVSDANDKPKALAGEDQVVTLPIDVLKLDGSKSTDDGNIVSYLWTKSEDSPGAGVVLDASDRKPVLLYSGVVAGNYSFTLTIEDDDGAKASDTVSIQVKQGLSAPSTFLSGIL